MSSSLSSLSPKLLNEFLLNLVFEVKFSLQLQSEFNFGLHEPVIFVSQLRERGKFSHTCKKSKILACIVLF
jgi:hypothetical protein